MNFISPFNRSGGAEFVGLRCFLVPSTKHFNPSALIKAGEANVHDGDTSTNRQQPWGNYSSSTIDPTDGQTFWLHGPYAKFTEKGYWSTWVAANSFYEPDLAFQSIQVDPILTRGKVSTAVAETQNIGKAFSGKFELALYYSADRVFSSSDTLLVSFDHYGLNSEGTAKDTLLYLLPSDVPLGMGFLIFVIDQRNLIPEESDSNNFAILPVNLVDPIHCLAEIF